MKMKDLKKKKKLTTQSTLITTIYTMTITIASFIDRNTISTSTSELSFSTISFRIMFVMITMFMMTLIAIAFVGIVTTIVRVITSPFVWNTSTVVATELSL